MNATWVKKCAFSALGCALASGTFAMAGSIPVNVDFSCTDGNGAVVAGGNICSVAHPTGIPGVTPISDWSQGFTGVAGAGTINIGTSSTSKFGSSWVSERGNPAAALGATAGTNTLTVTESGNYLFSFQNIDLGLNTNSTVHYTITGWDGGVEEFTYNGTFNSGATCGAGDTTCSTGLSWATIDDTLYSGDELTKLVITAQSTSTAYEDNLDLDASPAPEPGSLFLLGTGLLGLAFIAFRKSRGANMSLNS
jgi:hypothetical protein